MLNQMTQQEVSQIKSLQQKLRNNHNPVATPTDKVKPFRTASKSNCCKWAEDHLAKTAKEASRITLAEVKEQASQLLHDKVEPRILSDKEASFTKKMLNQMQRHHTADQRPTRFPTTNVPAGPAAPATNFTLTFPKTGYLGIKRIQESNRACVKNNNSSFTLQRQPWKPRNHLQQLHNNICRCWRFLPVSKTETGEKQSATDPRTHLQKIKSTPNTLPRLNQVGNPINATCFYGQMLGCDGDGGPEEKRVHHWWTQISMAGRSGTGAHSPDALP